ncbi:MAG TPA: CHAT domain-containing protein, partial [Myxococcaceae bacterium]|nr:CHAT domain-containing protein [Myxococcaceae bacterium]
IAADGVLHELPFPALVLPGAGRRVIEEHEVVLLPSVSAVAAVRGAGHPALHAGAVAVLADPVFDRTDPRVQRSAGPGKAVPRDLQRSMDGLGLQRLARLPGTRLEAEKILALAPPGQTLLAMGFEARRALAMDAAVSSYRILHFATHALLNSAHPELSGLVLSLVEPSGESQNGFLRLQDIYGLHIDADLVVLSACQTGLGKPVQGEGLVGLTRGFIHAGARQVLASLWKVSDRGTAELMKEFYRAMIVEGHTPSAALRQAQRMLARTRPFDAPYTWAAFVLEGDWQEPLHGKDLPPDGRAALATMRAAHDQRWYTTLTFVQRTRRWDAQGKETQETWFESLRHTPGEGTQLRIDRGSPSEGNGVLYSANETRSFRGGKQVSSKPGGNLLLPLIEGVYLQPVERTVAELAPAGIDWSRPVIAGEWEKRPVWIVGASSAADARSAQLWIDVERQVVVRAILVPVPGAPLMDVRFGGWVPLAGAWLGTRCEFLVGGKLDQVEEYTDWKAGQPLPASLFDPARFTAAEHWAAPSTATDAGTLK